VRVLDGVRVIVGVRVLVGVRVMVGVRVAVRVLVGVRVFVGVRVLVGVRVSVGVRVARAVTAAVEDECTIGRGNINQPIIIATLEMINQRSTRFAKIDLNLILPTPHANAMHLTPGRDCTRSRQIAVARLKKHCFFAIIPPLTERCQSG
jgi:hypothetical protein